MVHFAGDGGNEQESGKWGERNVSRGFPGEMTSDLQNKREGKSIQHLSNSRWPSFYSQHKRED